MKALTIRQPWATLIAQGQKTIETRSWRTHYRGPLLIHAGKDQGPNGQNHPTGCLLALVDLTDCRPLTPNDQDAAMCPIQPGRWAWVLTNIRPLDPVYMRGHQGLWTARVRPEALTTHHGAVDVKTPGNSRRPL